jgi:hypothetical protein
MANSDYDVRVAKMAKKKGGEKKDDGDQKAEGKNDRSWNYTG